MQTISLVLREKVVVCLHMVVVECRRSLRWLQQSLFLPRVQIRAFGLGSPEDEGLPEILSWPTVINHFVGSTLCAMSPRHLRFTYS